MGCIGMYPNTQLHSKMLVDPPKNLTISETEIGWLEIMACRAIRGEWIKFRNTSQNEGLDIKKYSVRFQTDSMAVHVPRRWPAWLTKKSSCASLSVSTRVVGAIAIQ